MIARTRSRLDTVELGKSLGAALKGGDVVALTGGLGTGKTTLVQGICQALGVNAHVASPTFTIVSEYRGSSVEVVHVDLYRIRTRSEVDDLGLEEYFNERTVCLIEWPEMIRDLLPPDYIGLRLDYGETDEERSITVEEREGLGGVLRANGRIRSRNPREERE